ncbi:TetR/AcrR family transcriptional regulator [Streptosporangium sp. NPDC023963]|uniref:TetR/AcrR family transcriptional regulator n=1 Tax=Streptosporangium sp. NPDC023963 TaxID=3155608 RepID=UPI00342B4A8F
MSLRDRKRARTRQTLVDAATDLFERDGYDETTIADIAAAADIGTRTFFSYFASKEELLFPESDARVRAAIEAIASRGPDDGPAEVLLRALRKVGDDSDDLAGRLAALRLRLVRTVPVVRGRALQMQFDAQREIARHLAAAFPEQLDEVSAAALTGAFVGAVTSALQVLLEDPDRMRDPAEVQAAVRRATDVALTPWLRAPAERPDHPPRDTA